MTLKEQIQQYMEVDFSKWIHIVVVELGVVLLIVLIILYILSKG